jgi:hypothetical protein
MARDDEHIELEGHVSNRTDKAVLFWVEKLDEEVWFPLSQCELDSDENTLLVPLWLARQRGLD